MQHMSVVHGREEICMPRRISHVHTIVDGNNSESLRLWRVWKEVRTEQECRPGPSTWQKHNAWRTRSPHADVVTIRTNASYLLHVTEAMQLCKRSKATMQGKSFGVRSRRYMLAYQAMTDAPKEAPEVSYWGLKRGRSLMSSTCQSVFWLWPSHAPAMSPNSTPASMLSGVFTARQWAGPVRERAAECSRGSIVNTGTRKTKRKCILMMLHVNRVHLRQHYQEPLQDAGRLVGLRLDSLPPNFHHSHPSLLIGMSVSILAICRRLIDLLPSEDILSSAECVVVVAARERIRQFFLRAPARRGVWDCLSSTMGAS